MPRTFWRWTTRISILVAYADARVREALGPRPVGRPDVAPVEKHGALQQRLEALEVRAAVLGPLGDQHQRIGSVGHAVDVFGEAYAVAVFLANSGHGLGVVSDDGGAFGEQRVDEVERGRLARVVGVGLER